MAIDILKKKVLCGKRIDKEEAMSLLYEPLEKLCGAADEIRKKYDGNRFDICAIMNVKGGRCSENCKFCAQSSCSTAQIDCFHTRNKEYVLEDALKHTGMGISHYCQVSSGRKLSKEGVDIVCENVKAIVANTDLVPCVSLGLLDDDDLLKLKAAGVKRIHNNLETSTAFFSKVCTSHTTSEKKDYIKRIKDNGFELCCGGVFGVGESWEDRIDMAFELVEIKPETVPVNMLKPVKGTPMENMKVLTKDDVRRIIAIYKFILPKSDIRLAAGRGELDDTGISCFNGGSNATITGNMLTVKGISIKEDLANIKELGYILKAI